jgi:hypothetical protein
VDAFLDLVLRVLNACFSLPPASSGFPERRNSSCEIAGCLLRAAREFVSRRAQPTNAVRA